MPFALIGYFLAIKTTEYSFNLRVLLLVLLCMMFARNAAMGFNRFIDRLIDMKNPRTAVREIPSGLISEKSALIFIIINILLFIVTAYFINNLVFYLSPIALIVILGYSYTKKFTALCHLILGLGLALAPIGAYLSVTGTFNMLPILFSLIVLFWVSGFDIIYALQDIGFDKSEKLKSVPVYLGEKKALILSTFLHLIVALLIITAGTMANFNSIFWIGSIIFISLLFYQHIIVKHDNLSKINLAFFTTNGIASLLFATFTILSLYY